MIAITVRGAEQASAHLEAARKTVVAGSARALQRAALIVQRFLRARVSAPGTPDGFWGRTSPAGAALAGRSGKTRQRITVGPLLKGLDGQQSVAVGSPDPHLKLHETGGIVTGNQFLRIPTARAQSASGVDINLGRSVRGLAGYHLIRTGAGRLWIVRDAGGPNSRRVDFMYLLVRSIRLRARKIFAISRMESEPIIARIFEGLKAEVVRAGNG